MIGTNEAADDSGTSAWNMHRNATRRSCLTVVLWAATLLFLGTAHATPTYERDEGYAEECRAAGVPIPPPFNMDAALGSGSPWVHAGPLNSTELFTGHGLETDVFYMPFFDGLCMVLSRGSGSSIDALGLICQNNRTNKACYWDAGGSATPIPASEWVCLLEADGCAHTFAGGTDLVGRSGGVCTDCHAGENAFVVHPETVLNLGADLLTPDNWVDPIVAADWPQNPGPANYYEADLIPESQLAGSECRSCHSNEQEALFPINGVPSYGGRFPEISTDNDRYCGVLDPVGGPARDILQAVPRTMPPLASSPPVLTAPWYWLEQACFQAPGSGRMGRAIFHHLGEGTPTRAQARAIGTMIAEGRSYGTIQDSYYRPWLRKLEVGSAPLIDGEIDSVWRAYASPQPIDTRTGFSVIEPLPHPLDTTAIDLAASWRGAWDDSYLYLLVEVDDDGGPQWNSTFPREDDSVVIHIDGGNEGQSSYDDNDRRYVFRAAQSGVVHSWQDTTGMLSASTPTDTGYALEVAIPWTTIGVLPGRRVGLEFYVNDDDEGTEDADAQVSWWTRSADSTSAPSDTTPVDMVTQLSPLFLSNEILVDGNPYEQDWLFTAQHDINRTASPIARSNNTATWSAIWDEVNLYVIVRAQDSNIAVPDSADPYQDDSIEVFLDLNHSRESNFDGHDDFQLIIKPRQGWVVYLGDNSVVQPTTGVQSAAQFDTSVGTYSVELAIPWKWLKYSPASGSTFGLEVQLNDDDGTGNREGKLAWCSDDNDTYHNPALFCAAQLVGANIPVPSIPRVARNNVRFQPDVSVYVDGTPNPHLTIDGVIDDLLWTSTLADSAHPIDEPILDSPSLVGEWRSAWNEDYLYFQVSVMSDGVPVEDGSQRYNNDSVEIYLDAGHSRGTDYNPQTFQYLFAPGCSTPPNGNNAAAGCTVVDVGHHSSDAPTGGFVVRSTSRNNGYDMEIAMPWRTLGMLPEPTARFGLEVQLNDDDDDGTINRVGKVAWFATDLLGDVAWERPDAMATVELEP